MAARVTASRTAIQLAQRDPATATQLFDVVSEALPAEQAGRTGITVYDTAGRPLAWAGRVLDLAKERIGGPAALFVAPGALGPRLVRVEPVVDPAAARRAPGDRRGRTVALGAAADDRTRRRRRRRLHVARPGVDPHGVRRPRSARRWRRRGQVPDSIAHGRASGRGPRVPRRPVRGTLAVARANAGRQRARRRHRPALVRRAAARHPPPRAHGTRFSCGNRRDRRSSCWLPVRRSCGSFRRSPALNLLDRRPTSCWPP